MADVVPSGLFSLPLSHLATLLSNCAAFRTWTSTEDAAAALERIYYVEFPTASATRPFAVIDFDENWGGEAIAGGASNTFVHEGSLLLLFRADIAEANQAKHENSTLAFTNSVGAVLSAMEALSGTSGYLNIVGIDRESGPARSSDTEETAGSDYYMEMAFTIRWSDM